MFVSDKYKLIFVHIQKTGGASIRSAIGYGKDVHWYHSPIFSADVNSYPGYYKFAVVRNSWELCASCYRFECLGVDKRPEFKKNLTFEQWLIQKESNKNHNHAPFPHQLSFISHNGEILVDKIMRYETLPDEYAALCKEKSIPNNLGRFHHHSYGGYDWRKLLTSNDIELVREMCKEDIDYWGFEP